MLGLQDLSDEDLRSMLKEGDFDGDGALSQMEFCVLMFRLSPELMEESYLLLDEAIQQEFQNCNQIYSFNSNFFYVQFHIMCIIKNFMSFKRIEDDQEI